MENKEMLNKLNGDIDDYRKKDSFSYGGQYNCEVSFFSYALQDKERLKTDNILVDEMQKKYNDN